MWSLTTHPTLTYLQMDLFECRDIIQKTRLSGCQCVSLTHLFKFHTAKMLFYLYVPEWWTTQYNTQSFSQAQTPEYKPHVIVFKVTGESASHDWKTTNRATWHHSLVITLKSKWGGCHASKWVISYMGANLVLHYTDLIDLSCSTVVQYTSWKACCVIRIAEL